MLSLSGFPLVITRTEEDTDEWFKPVLNRGRGAVFVDTGFIKALLSNEGDRSTYAKLLWSETEANFYTTNLVCAEAIRQVVKGHYPNARQREDLFDECKRIFVENSDIFVCAPPRDMIIKAYNELANARLSIDPSLDLCDMLSITVLDYAMHKRVFGFDNHFASHGAALEP